MKHRERVAMTLSHEIPDRCPIQVSFTPEFAVRLRHDLEQRGMLETPRDGIREHNPHGGGNTYELECIIDSDLILTPVGWANSYYQKQFTYTDEWGIGWRSIQYGTKFGTGRYTEIAHHPLAEDHAIDRYTPPDPQRDELYREAEGTLKTFQDEFWIVGVTVTTVFETAWALRGLEKLLMDFVVDPELADRILDIPYQYHFTAAKRLVQMGVDMIWIGDDVGGQHGMVISPDHWRKFLKPRFAEFITTLKEMNPEVKIAYHSDGNIYPIIPELIEIGLDVLNPVQPASMDPTKLKNEYSDRLCFWGSIDEQQTLPFGSPEDVRQEVLTRLRTLGRGGGLILGPTHHVQLDTPMENFWAMTDTIRESKYTHT